MLKDRGLIIGVKYHPGEACKVIELIKGILNRSDSDDLQMPVSFCTPTPTIEFVSFISDQVQYLKECSLKSFLSPVRSLRVIY